MVTRGASLLPGSVFCGLKVGPRAREYSFGYLYLLRFAVWRRVHVFRAPVSSVFCDALTSTFAPPFCAGSDVSSYRPIGNETLL